jgi:hypothetical protein
MHISTWTYILIAACPALQMKWAVSSPSSSLLVIAYLVLEFSLPRRHMTIAKPQTVRGYEVAFPCFFHYWDLPDWNWSVVCEGQWRADVSLRLRLLLTWCAPVDPLCDEFVLPSTGPLQAPESTYGLKPGAGRYMAEGSCVTGQSVNISNCSSCW